MIYYVIISILLIVIFFIFTGKKIFNSSVVRKLRNENEDYRHYLDVGIVNDKFYKSLKKEIIEITSTDGLKLSSFFIPNENKSNKYIILVHGISVGYIGSVKYIEPLYKDGFNILVIHQRRHGKSEGKYSTYGYFEKEDVNLWINYLLNRFGNDIILGLHGESMGASTVMQVIPLNKHIKFIIEDCGYSDLYELMKFLIDLDYPKLLAYPLYLSLSLTNIFIRLKAKFNMHDVSPIKIVKDSTIPIMFIHGSDDVFVPTYMCKNLYKAKRIGLKEILIIDGATHANSIEINKKLYEEKMLNFIHRALKN